MRQIKGQWYVKPQKLQKIKKAPGWMNWLFIIGMPIGLILLALGIAETMKFNTLPSTAHYYQNCAIDQPVWNAQAGRFIQPVNTDCFILPQKVQAQYNRTYASPLYQGIHELANQGQISQRTLKELTQTQPKRRHYHW